MVRGPGPGPWPLTGTSPGLQGTGRGAGEGPPASQVSPVSRRQRRLRSPGTRVSWELRSQVPQRLGTAPLAGAMTLAPEPPSWVLGGLRGTAAWRWRCQRWDLGLTA